jgi:hypothetical protein
MYYGQNQFHLNIAFFEHLELFFIGYLMVMAASFILDLKFIVLKRGLTFCSYLSVHVTNL